MKARVYLFVASLLLIVNLCEGQKQFTADTCKSINYDTISAIFVAECDNLESYFNDPKLSINTIGGRGGFIFRDQDYNKRNVGECYCVDTVFIGFWIMQGYQFYKNLDSCLNQKALIELIDKAKGVGISKKETKRLRKNSFLGENGIMYYKFRATLVFIDIGKKDWEIPCPHSHREICLTIRKEGTRFCNYSVGHTLYIADMYNFRILR